MTALLQTKAFHKVPPANIQAVFMRMQRVDYRAGEVVIKQGDPGDYFYVVVKGSCSVARETPLNKEGVKLAELKMGETFGEEALISEAKRNATITMLTDGVLMRLSKQDFRTLLHEPLLQWVEWAEAKRIIAGGGQWLDVRLPSEYDHYRAEGSLNIPAQSLRLKMKGLDRNVHYVVCCDTGRRSSACGYLLSERGFQASVLRNGLPAADQEACLRALKSWSRNGPPRDAAAWLVMVGRNAGIDGVRKQARERPLPPEDLISDLSDAEQALVDRVDEADYRDDILRLLFVCCHPDLPATQQIALALRIVSGLSVTQIARAFLVSEAAMEQRITRAKARVAAAHVPFETPGAIERGERLAVVAAMVYLLFNEGYTAHVAEHGARAPLCEEAIRLARLLLRLYPAEPEIMGLLALLLLQHARAPARFDAEGAVVLLADQDRALWNRTLIAEGLALIDKAVRHRRAGPYQAQAAIAALHACAATPLETDWAGIEQLYGALERMQPSPVVTLNRAVAISKVRGAAEALPLIEPLAPKLGGYFYFHGARGGPRGSTARAC